MSNFPSLKELMSKWNNYCLTENKKNSHHKSGKQAKIRSIIDGQSLIIFFKKGGNIFGAPEEGRIVFARMKNPNEDDPIPDDASFSAFDLMQAINGNSQESLFSLRDLPAIDIITRDQAEDALMQCPDKGQNTPVLMPSKSQKDIGIQAIPLKDKE